MTIARAHILSFFILPDFACAVNRLPRAVMMLISFPIGPAFAGNRPLQRELLLGMAFRRFMQISHPAGMLDLPIRSFP
jgi:hypothetical protein